MLLNLRPLVILLLPLLSEFLPLVFWPRFIVLNAPRGSSLFPTSIILTAFPVILPPFCFVRIPKRAPDFLTTDGLFKAFIQLRLKHRISFRKKIILAGRSSILLLGLKGQVAVITFNVKTPLRASSNRAKEGKRLNKKKHGGEIRQIKLMKGAFRNHGKIN